MYAIVPSHRAGDLTQGLSIIGETFPLFQVDQMISIRIIFRNQIRNLRKHWCRDGDGGERWIQQENLVCCEGAGTNLLEHSLKLKRIELARPATRGPTFQVEKRIQQKTIQSQQESGLESKILITCPCRL